jgi:hypothetical protein
MALLALGALRGSAAAQDEPIALHGGQPYRGEIGLGAASSLCFTLELPEDVVALDLLLACPLADLDLYANPGGHAEELELSEWIADGDEGVEHIHARRLGEPSLEGGSLTVCVSYPYDAPPLVGGRKLESAGFTLEARVFAARVDAQLTLGTVLRGTLPADGGNFRTYELEVPPGVEALRIDLFDTAFDLDLFARHRRRLLVFTPLLAAQQNSWGAETILLTPDGMPRLRPGTWYVQVENQVDPQDSVSFALLASEGAGVPEPLRGLPELAPPADARGIPRALSGVFELFCGHLAGSGTCVTSSGLLLTNGHVVDTGRGDPVIVCVPLTPGLPAKESFRGRVVELDRERDLALVQIETSFWGEPLPAGYRFPAVPLGEPSALQFGDALFLAGYPSTGGQKSRVTISLSRGIVSGFEQSPHGRLIKTDAEIGGGSSGGAALDAQGRLVGVPTSTVELGSGQFGYVQPLDALPAGWRARLGPFEPR